MNMQSELKNILKKVLVGQTKHRPLLDLNRTQWLTNNELIALQNMLLSRLVIEAYYHVPYYKRLMDQSGINPNRVRCVDDLKQFPILTKDIIRKNYGDMVHENHANLKKHFTGTGGSTGHALQYFITPEVYYYGLGCRNRGYHWAGFNEEKDRVVYLAGGSLGVTNKIEIDENKLKIPAVGICDNTVMGRYYDAITGFEPKHMRAYPSALYEFCRFLKHTNKKVKFDSIVTTAENLYTFQRNFIEDVIGCKIFDQYGAYDGGAGAFECEEHSGYHEAMERGIIEIVDEHDAPVPPGRPGRIISTDLHNYCMPFIRYDVGDVAVAHGQTCPCGRGLSVIDSIEGRSSDYIQLSDGTRYSGESIIHLFNLLYQQNRIDFAQYQVIQRHDDSVDVLLVKGNKPVASGINAIFETLSIHLSGLKISVHVVDEIKVSKSGKFRFVFTEIENNQVNVRYQKENDPHLASNAPIITIDENPLKQHSPQKNPAILFLCQSDYCLIGFNYAAGLNQLGLNAKSLVSRPRPYEPFRYRNQSPVLNKRKLCEQAEASDIIIWTHSQHVELPVSTKGKYLGVQHGGIAYRNDVERQNRFFNALVDFTIMEKGEFLDRGAKNEVWILPAVDPADYHPVLLNGNPKIVIGHFPSNPEYKGSPVINAVMEKLSRYSEFSDLFEYRFAYRPGLIPRPENLRRMARCDIYIESCPVNSFKMIEGSTSIMESAALGNVVVTGFPRMDRYQKEFGDCPIRSIMSAQALENTMVSLIREGKRKIIERRKATFDWVYRNHGLIPTARRLVDRVLRNILGFDISTGSTMESP